MQGRSSKSFIDEERLLPIVDRIKPGDYLLIQFGHNDEKPDEARRTEPFTTFKDYLKKYITVARDHGATPVLLTSVVRRRFENDRLVDTHGDYPTAVRQLAQETHTQFIDLEAKSRKLYESLGEEGTKQLLFWLKPGERPDYPEGVEDNTHFNQYGAWVIAGLVAEGLRELGNSLQPYIILP